MSGKEQQPNQKKVGLATWGEEQSTRHRGCRYLFLREEALRKWALMRCFGKERKIVDLFGTRVTEILKVQKKNSPQCKSDEDQIKHTQLCHAFVSSFGRTMPEIFQIEKEHSCTCESEQNQFEDKNLGHLCLLLNRNRIDNNTHRYECQCQNYAKAQFYPGKRLSSKDSEDEHCQAQLSGVVKEFSQVITSILLHGGHCSRSEVINQ